MGACCTKEDIQENKQNKEKDSNLSMQEQLHKHWNGKQCLKNLYPSLNARLISTSNINPSTQTDFNPLLVAPKKSKFKK